MVTTASGAAVASAKKAAAKRAAAKRKASKSPARKASKSRSPSKKRAAPAASGATGDLVAQAIAALGDKDGSSLAAIKKYISATHGVDAERLEPAIKAYLKTSGQVVKAQGFKLSEALAAKPKRSASRGRPAKKAAAKKTTTKRKTKKVTAKAPKPRAKASKVVKAKKTAGKRKAPKKGAKKAKK